VKCFECAFKREFLPREKVSSSHSLEGFTFLRLVSDADVLQQNILRCRHSELGDEKAEKRHEQPSVAFRDVVHKYCMTTHITAQSFMFALAGSFIKKKAAQLCSLDVCLSPAAN
jgi:hypothetical protein